MPLILIVGLPCTGKTTRAKQIQTFLVENFNRNVHVVSENDVIRSKNLDKNIVYSGFRYELYCASKNSKTTQLTVECVVSKEETWMWNEQRTPSEKYSREIFEALYLRYEPPDSRNRWDSPLLFLQEKDSIDGKAITDTLFHRKPPPPNQSTQTAPLSSANFLYELDKITQDVVSAILTAKKLGLEGPNVKIPGYETCSLERLPSTLTAAQLARYRRQFLNYSKLHPPASQTESANKLAQLFVQFLNSSLSAST
ncbi:protein KTI12 homolog isoform X2 [Rhodnius prolixus]|uniref:protein KTI12 homolog isoform X2 n=1 Tax=Rhodnius prolixus TaxID=13249 RepID=UPI003D18FC3D